MNNNNVTSPCISVCKTDPISGFCYGCGRTNEEKKMWSDDDTSNEWKLANLNKLQNRLSMGCRYTATSLETRNGNEKATDSL